MFKQSKKILKEEIYLKDKYFFLNDKNIDNDDTKKEDSFLSNLQINSILKDIDKNSKFNILKKTFENKVRLEMIDIIYALSFMVILPAIICYFVYNKLFLNNGVDGIIAYGGTFGAFFISGLLLVGLTSRLYEKISGGTSLHEIKKVRGENAFCDHIRENKKISETFKLILNQRRKMKPNYRNKSLSSDDKREYYDELKFEEFTYSEKKLIKSIIKDLEKEI
jgi:hypothetical protein